MIFKSNIDFDTVFGFHISFANEFGNFLVENKISSNIEKFPFKSIEEKKLEQEKLRFMDRVHLI